MTRKKKQSTEAAVREIRRRTRRKFAPEEKVRIVLEGLRGEQSISELCRREGIAANLYYRWSKDFLEAGKKQLAGDTVREATSAEVKELRAEEVLGSLLREHPKVLEDPEPMVRVHKLTEYATQFIVRPWVNREDYWPVYWELMREAKLRLDREQLPLGIPRHDVQFHGEPSV
jgi:transposase